MSRPNRLHVIQLAAAAPSDPRTAAGFLEGKRIRSDLLRERLTEAAKRLGLEPASSIPPQSAA